MSRFLLAALALVPAVILLVPVFVVAGMFLFVSSTVRLLARAFEPAFVPWSDLMTFDKRLGWRPRANIDRYYLADADDVYRIETDAEGWPGHKSMEESAVVVIGDSFAFGYGIDAGRSFADGTSLAIKQVGAPGYSMVQGVLLMEELAERLSGKLVVWFICLENDLQDAVSPGVWRYRAPFVRRSTKGSGWEIVTDHVVPTQWQSPDWSWKRIFPHLCVPGPLSDRVYEGCDYLVRRAVALCEKVDAQLVLLTIPDLTQLTETGRATLASASGSPATCDVQLPDRRLAEICQRHGIPIVAGMRHLAARDYKPREKIHWNEKGHHRVSALITQLHDSFKRGELKTFGTCQASALLTPKPPITVDPRFAMSAFREHRG